MAIKTIKKPVRQPAVKKNLLVGGAKKVVSAKKGSAGSTKKKPLVVASGEMCFWVNNGGSLSSMQDLRDAFRTMSEEQFLHHTGMGRNDFSAWVLNVLGDKQCAADISRAKNMEMAQAAVEKHLKTYSV